MTELSEYRATLERLQAYELPEELQPDPVENTEEIEQIVQRFETARNNYLPRHLEEVFHQHLKSTFNGEHTDEITEEDMQELEEATQLAEERLNEAAEKAYEKQQRLHTKYETFVTRREEIARMIADMEDPVYDNGDEDYDKENDGEEVTEQELAAEEEFCNAQSKRRAELEARVAELRRDVARKEKSLEETNRRLLEIRQNENEIPTMENLEDFKAETQEMQKKANKLKEMSDWYTSMCGLLEELNGIKILGVEKDEESSSIFLKIQLLGIHDIEVRLVPDHRKEQNLRVENAKFLTSTIVTGPQGDTSPPLELFIPDLQDLVQLCRTMGPLEDLRFLLREARGRISAIAARVGELSVLREKYLTKIGVHRHTGHSFGGEDQEIVCSISEGVTVVVKLTPDCPLLNGSAYIDQIIGVGGWEQQVLDEIKDTMNEMRFRGPVQLMDALKEELTRLQSIGKLSLPTTPQLPTRGMR